MGYYSYATGRIMITPPLPWGAVTHSKFAEADFDDFGYPRSIVRFEIDTDMTVIDDSTVSTTKTVTVVVPVPEGAIKAYDLEDELGEIAQLVTQHGSTCVGAIVRFGEEPGDIERYFITADGTVTTEKARLTWPDGTEVDL
jgi:hypothetical protein